MADAGEPRLYSCYKCRNRIALHDDIVSKWFQVIIFLRSVVRSSLGFFLFCFFQLNKIDLRGCDDDGWDDQAKKGRAFLFSHAMNVVEGPKEDRLLMTGLHTVADVHCSDCREVLGWKYERAFEESQKYKEGKIVLEKFKIVKENW